MIIAIIAAVRTNWKDEGNQKDAWYFWRNAHSNIWYSSEIVGTIIVQCIPVLRPLLRDFHTSKNSRKLASIPDDIAHNSNRPPTIGQGSNHRAHIYSDARSIYNEKDEMMVDSWDTQGIYTKTDFELTTLELKGHEVKGYENKDHEVKDQKTKEAESSDQRDKHWADFSFA
jgi:hypothetical protein